MVKLCTSDVGFKHGGVDVDVKVHGVLQERRHALKLCVVSQNLQKNIHKCLIITTTRLCHTQERKLTFCEIKLK